MEHPTADDIGHAGVLPEDKLSPCLSGELHLPGAVSILRSARWAFGGIAAGLLAIRQLAQPFFIDLS